jgi:hypothetical protein
MKVSRHGRIQGVGCNIHYYCPGQQRRRRSPRLKTIRHDQTGNLHKNLD